MTERIRHFIGGVRVDGERHVERYNPSDTRDCVAQVPAAGPDTAAAAMKAAREAFGDWSRSTPEFRSDVLDRAGRILIDRSAEIGARLSREEGKLLAEGVGETVRAGRIFRYFAGEAIRAHGRTLRSPRAGVHVETSPEPVGVIILITPWNFPVAIPSWKAAPALAFGNTVVLKPSSMSALLASDLAGVLEEAGAPAGVFNVVFGEAQTAQSLLTHPDADAVSFTGSQATGGQIAQVAAQRGLRFQLEMGGKNPLVILADADIERAVACAVDGAYGSSGQRCTASSRFICEEAVYDEFVARMVDRLHAIRVGHALDPSSQMGPLAFEAQFEKSLSFISGACAEGGRLLSGGVESGQQHPGWYIRPTLIADAPEHARIHCEEVFGPVATVQRVRDLDEAIRLSNATAFGLSAGIMTRSLSSARRFRDEVRAGMVMVNLATAGVDYHAPFGGMRGSSFGHREQGYAAIDFYTQVKTSYSWS